jgi:hypothetical protein
MLIVTSFTTPVETGGGGKGGVVIGRPELSLQNETGGGGKGGVVIGRP